MKHVKHDSVKHNTSVAMTRNTYLRGQKSQHKFRLHLFDEIQVQQLHIGAPSRQRSFFTDDTTFHNDSITAFDIERIYFRLFCAIRIEVGSRVINVRK